MFRDHSGHLSLARVPKAWWWVLGTLGVFLGFLSWAIASPIGSSPDEDFHMGSIWCPTPSENSGCDVVVGDEGSVEAVLVPESVASSAHCHAFQPDQSAACVDEYSDQRLVESTRFDAGGYPFGYYQFHHLLVGEDVQASVAWMRVMNVFLGLGLLGVAVALAPRSVRQPALVAAVVSWVPMGVYFIASLNPSSWALSGVLIFGVAGYSAANSQGFRRWASLGVSLLGAVLAVSSRADSAFYIILVAVALWVFVPANKSRWPELVASLVAVVAALAAFLTSGQAANVTGDGGWPTYHDLSFARLLTLNLLSVPNYLAGFWGMGAGPGWFDVYLHGWSSLAMLFTAGGVFFVGMKGFEWRRLFVAVFLGGALVGIPAVALAVRHSFPTNAYQPRYLLPLLPVFFFFWLVARGGLRFSSTGRVTGLAIVASLANLLALRSVMARYTSGYFAASLEGLPFFREVEWWPWMVPPELVLWGGSLAFALGISMLLFAATVSARDLAGGPGTSQSDLVELSEDARRLS